MTEELDETARPNDDVVDADIVEEVAPPFTLDVFRLDVLQKAREVMSVIDTSSKTSQKEIPGLAEAASKLAATAVELEFAVNSSENMRQQIKEELLAQARASKAGAGKKRKKNK